MKLVFVSLMGIGILTMTVVLVQATNEQESAATLWTTATLPAPIQKMASNYSSQCQQLGGHYRAGLRRRQS